MRKEKMNTAFDGNRSYEYLRELTVGIGPRLGGSREEVKAARYVKRMFGKFGLKSSLFPFRIHTFDKTSASLSFSGLGAVKCLPVPCCASTPKRGVTAPMVYVEAGNEACLDESMKGKIIFTPTTFGGKHYETMVKIKPAGVVVACGKSFVGPFRQKLHPEIKRKYGSVPMIYVSNEEGRRILKKRPSKCTMMVATSGEKMATSYDPIGELKGSEFPDEVIVIGGHLDSVWGSQGSQDNAAGMAVVMELARVFARKGSKRTLRFMGFAGEEQGLRGSKAYVKKLKEKDDKLKKNKDFVQDGIKTELDKIVFMVNVDVQGALLGTNTAVSFGHPDIAASARLLSAETGRPFSVQENNVYSSDNAPFGKAGVPSLSFSRWDSSTGVFGHTDSDIIDHCDPEALEKAGSFIAEWMTRYITEAPTMPFPRKISGSEMEKVDKYFGGQDIFKYEPTFSSKKYRAKKSSVKKRRKKKR